MMTKKDYERAVKIICHSHRSAEVVEAFIQFFQGDNPRFDEDRFVEACEKESKKS